MAGVPTNSRPLGELPRGKTPKNTSYFKQRDEKAAFGTQTSPRLTGKLIQLGQETGPSVSKPLVRSRVLFYEGAGVSDMNQRPG